MIPYSWINEAPFVFVVAWLVVCVLTLEVVNYPWFVFEIPVPSLELTAKAPENGWLEYDRCPVGPGLFSGSIVCFSEGKCPVIFNHAELWWSDCWSKTIVLEQNLLQGFQVFLQFFPKEPCKPTSLHAAAGFQVFGLFILP